MATSGDHDGKPRDAVDIAARVKSKCAGEINGLNESQHAATQRAVRVVDHVDGGAAQRTRPSRVAPLIGPRNRGMSQRGILAGAVGPMSEKVATPSDAGTRQRT